VQYTHIGGGAVDHILIGKLLALNVYGKSERLRMSLGTYLGSNMVIMLSSCIDEVEVDGD